MYEIFKTNSPASNVTRQKIEEENKKDINVTTKENKIQKDAKGQDER